MSKEVKGSLQGLEMIKGKVVQTHKTKQRLKYDMKASRRWEDDPGRRKQTSEAGVGMEDGQQKEGQSKRGMN